MQPYDVDWFRSLAQYHRWNEQALWAVFSHLGRPSAYADFGCGDGWMVRTARMTGALSIGYEFVDAARIVGSKWARIVIANIAEPQSFPSKFDLVTSIEVGEHIPEAYADTYIKNLTDHSLHYLVFTAAIPGQGGNGHINCQPQEYWREKIEANGLEYVSTITDQLRETWKWCTGPMFWLPQNVQVFQRKVAGR